MTNKEELKPCPFCGSEGQIIILPEHEYDNYMAECSAGIECPIFPNTSLCETKRQAIKAWNTRPSEPVEGEEKLKELLDKLQSLNRHNRTEEFKRTIEQILQLFRTRGEGNG